MKLSIIVPMYNVEKYIDNCIKSLLRQNISEDEYEIIIINDGSTDGSVEIVREYVEKFKNLKLINVTNGGQSKARNIGINNSLGKYIFFVDSDDYISENSLNETLNKAIDNNLDMIFFDIKQVNDENELLCNYNENSEILIKSGIEYFSDNNVNNGPWHYFIKREFIIDNKLKFEEGRMCEDGMFLIASIFSAQRVSYNKVDIYRYVKRNNSTTTKKSQQHLLKIIDDFIFAINYINKYYKKAIDKKYPIEFIKKLESRRNSYIYFCQIRMIRCSIGLKRAKEIIKQLEEINCYKYNRMNKNYYPGLKTTIVWKILNLKYIFYTLCIDRNYKKLLHVKNV